jgi:hypothetical protein
MKEAIMPIHLKEEVILVIGAIGTDAPYSVLTPHGLKHVPGNNPMAREAYEALTKSYAKLQQIAQTGEQTVR